MIIHLAKLRSAASDACRATVCDRPQKRDVSEETIIHLSLFCSCCFLDCSCFCKIARYSFAFFISFLVILVVFNIYIALTKRTKCSK